MSTWPHMKILQKLGPLSCKFALYYDDRSITCNICMNVISCIFIKG
jgi:hypothetical protein